MPISPLRKYKFTSKRFNPCLPTKSSLGNISRLNTLPDELLLMVINYLPNSDLLNLRPVNKHIGHIAQEILGKRINQILKILEIQKKSIETCYQEMLSVKKPQLDHFKQFLNQGTSLQLKELSWYNTVPLELQFVCECLVTLKQGPLSSTNQMDKWAEIRRSMTRLDFKNWFINLESNVDLLKMENVEIVKEIIIRNPSINYERIREISVCGYNVLILIAACLQYGMISQDLKIKFTELKIIQEKSLKAIKFFNFL